MKRLATFIKQNGITATTQRIMSREGGDWGPGARHWIVTLVRGTKQFAVEFTQGSAHTKPPTVEDVLDCLASDIAGVEQEQTFEGWASSLGYDPDSRKAETIYNTIKAQSKALRSFLRGGLGDRTGRGGRGGYAAADAIMHELLYETERE